MVDINKIEEWYNNYNFQYNSHDIFLVYLQKDINPTSTSFSTKKVYENNQLIIKPLGNIKSSDIDDSIRSNRQLILYIDRPISLTNLSILKHTNDRCIYFDLDINQNDSLFTFHTCIPTIIIQNDMPYIQNLFEIFLSSNKNKKSIFSQKSIHTFLLRDKKNISLATIQNDIEFLEHHNKLTSRLAIFIYKICTFEFDASEKEIGLYFSSSFGKSTPLNKKSYGIKNVKGYDISRYPDNPIFNTRMQIAHRLFCMQNETINRNTIFKVTGIDINDVQF